MRVCAIAGILFSLIFVASNESVRASDANWIQKMMANALRQQALWPLEPSWKEACHRS
jgi:hypothetical protein